MQEASCFLEVHLLSSGTLLVASGLFSTDEAKKTKEMLKSDLIYGYKVKNLRHDLDRYLGASRYDYLFRPSHDPTKSIFQRAQKIVGAYEDGKPFSVELVSAVCSLALNLVVVQVAQFEALRHGGKQSSQRRWITSNG